MKPFWSWVSLALPLGVALLGAVIVGTSRSGAGDFAGRLGSGVLLVLAIGLACLLGEAAALVSLFRGERHAWLGALGLIFNLVIILPIAAVLVSD
jgi:hypothetical protein